MISMSQKHEILRKYIYDGESIRSISREMGMSRNTIRNYIREYESNKEKVLLNQKEEAKNKLIKLMSEEPKYDTSKRKKRVLTEEIKEKIQFFLERNEGRPRKQRMNSQDIYESLTSEGIKISYGTVNNEVKRQTKKSKEAFIKQIYKPGEVCEFDWGEVELTINEKTKKYKLAVFTSAINNYRFGYVYPKEATEFFLDAHVKFFEKVGGVYKTLVYDNMRVAVAKFVGNTEKEATISLQSISKYYGFDYRFCNVRRGNEKGHVEKSVDVVRKAFKHKIEFESLSEANKYLLEMTDKDNDKIKKGTEKSATEMLKEELPHLLPIMPSYDVGVPKDLRADKYSTILVENNRYSVPDSLVKEFVLAKIYPEYIKIFKNNQVVAIHKRNFGSYVWSMEIMHYKKTLTRKPGALSGSLAFEQLENKLKNIYRVHFTESPRDFIKLLDEVVEHSLEKVLKSIEKLTTQKIKVDLSTIKLMLQRNNSIDYCIENSNEANREIIEKANENIIEASEIFGLKSLKQKEAIL